MRPQSHFDWHAIRAMYEAGDGVSAISKHPNMPTKQAISVRARKEGWTRIATQLTQVDGEIDAQLIPFDGLDEEQRFVCNEIAKGATQRLAAEMIGRHETTISDWKAQNPKFATALIAAKAAKVRRRLSKIDDSVDWRAAGWLLERDPDSRGEYSPPNSSKGMVGNTFNVLGHVSVGIERDFDNRIPQVRNDPLALDAGGGGQES